MEKLELEKFLSDNKLYIGTQAYGDMGRGLWVSLVAGHTDQDYMIIVSHDPSTFDWVGNNNISNIEPRVITRIIECGSIEEMFEKSHPLVDSIEKDPTNYLAHDTE